MRVATWNINGLRARWDFFAHWLDARQPDVVALQELKLTNDQFPHEDLAKLGYHAAVHGQKAWNGVAVVAKSRPELVQAGLPGEEELGARLVTAMVDDIEVTSVYIPNGKRLDHDDFPAKLAWLDRLAAHVDVGADTSRAAVLCGDFNVVPAGIDSWNEARLTGGMFHTDVERERFATILNSGFHDLFRELYPDEQKFSWWDYRGGAFHRKQGLRIDFLLGTAPIRDRVTSVEIDREYRKKKDGLTASDHAPVFCDLT